MFAFLIGLKTISPRELQQLVQAGGVTVCDVNARQSWLTARVPGAHHLTPEYHPDDLPIEKTATLVFYCSNAMCRKAPNAARRAKALGYADVRVMSAGISGWLAARLPTQYGE